MLSLLNLFSGLLRKCRPCDIQRFTKTKTKPKWKQYSGRTELFVVSLLTFLDPTAALLLLWVLCGVALPLPLHLARFYQFLLGQVPYFKDSFPWPLLNFCGTCPDISLGPQSYSNCSCYLTLCFLAWLQT